MFPFESIGLQSISLGAHERVVSTLICIELSNLVTPVILACSAVCLQLYCTITCSPPASVNNNERHTYSINVITQLTYRMFLLGNASILIIFTKSHQGNC